MAADISIKPMIPLPWRLLQAIQWLLKQANKKDWSLIGSARQKGFHFLFYMTLPAQRFFPSFPSYKDVISLPLCLKIRFNVVLEEGVRFWNVFSSSNIACFTFILKGMWTLIILRVKASMGVAIISMSSFLEEKEVGTRWFPLVGKRNHSWFESTSVREELQQSFCTQQPTSRLWREWILLSWCLASLYLWRIC